MAAETGALVAPTLSYGYKSVPCMVRLRRDGTACMLRLRARLHARLARTRAQGGGPFIGTTGLDAATLAGQLRDVMRELVRHGVRRILILDGHFENQMFTVEAANLVRCCAVLCCAQGVACARRHRTSLGSMLARCVARWYRALASLEGC